MGLGDLFRRRRERESAIPASSTDTQALGAFAAGAGQPVVGQQIDGGAPGFTGMPANLSDLPGMIESMQSLAALGPMIQQAMADGNVQQDASQTIDLRGTGLREEILGIMAQHGIDPASGQQIDASSMPEMQQQILDSLGRFGIDASGSSSEFGNPDDPK